MFIPVQVYRVGLQLYPCGIYLVLNLQQCGRITRGTYLCIIQIGLGDLHLRVLLPVIELKQQFTIMYQIVLGNIAMDYKTI